MTAKIHPSALVDPKAQLGSNVEIGAFSIIGSDVKIGDGTVIKSHVVIEGNSTIGKNNLIYPFTTIGMAPQDLKFKNEKSEVVIGDNNVIREHVTIHLGTQDGTMLTKVGSNCLLMVAVHIAHDCTVGDHAILANNATLAGHVSLGDHVVIGGLSAVHQFVRIGTGAMIGGMSGVERDVIPNGLVMGERASLAGLNIVGMKRRGIARDDIHALRNFFKQVFEKHDEPFSTRVEKLTKDSQSPSLQEVASFVTNDSSRSFLHPKDYK